MISTRYLPTNESIIETANAGQISAAKALLKAAEIKRDEVRFMVEDNPQRSDSIKKDVYFQLGYVAALNFVLGLPGLAKEIMGAADG